MPASRKVGSPMSTAASTATPTATPMPIHGVSPAFTTSSTVT